MHPVVADYPCHTLSFTLTCSIHIGTLLYETHIAGQEESGGVEYIRSSHYSRGSQELKESCPCVVYLFPGKDLPLLN